MSGKPKTTHESWHRVTELRPRLRATVQLHRRRFRGRTWFVASDESGEQYFRIGMSAWRLAGLFDGHRTVAAAWNVCRDELGEEAPTQAETMQLLGHLQSANLLVGESPSRCPHGSDGKSRPHWHPLNLLFLRIPLFNPNRMLDRWSFAFSWLFSLPGFALWLGLMGYAAGALLTAGQWSGPPAINLLSAADLPLLYLALVLCKTLHELGHAFACRAFGARAGTGGEVHEMGIMLLLFAPVPYVDASSAWVIRSKLQRIVVGLAGVMAELAVAAVAAIVWTATPEGAAIHAFSYHVMIVAGISTILFNGNPLMRYDGYFALSDLLEMPNLSQRSSLYIQYLVKRFIYGLRDVRSPAIDSAERKWLLSYACASTIYRAVVCCAILWMLVDAYFLVGVLLAAVAFFYWVLRPLGMWIRYLALSVELAAGRIRALLTTLAGGASVAAAILLVPTTDSAYADGIVEAERFTQVFAGEEGVITEVVPSGTRVGTGGPLVRLDGRSLFTERDVLQAEAEIADTLRRDALRIGDSTEAQLAVARGQLVEQQLERVRARIRALVIRAPFEGTWVASRPVAIPGHFVDRGARMGQLVAANKVVIRATADQSTAGRLFSEKVATAVVRALGRPDLESQGHVETLVPAGQGHLPTAALGLAAGGSMAVSLDEGDGTSTLEPFFEVVVRPDSRVGLRPGQRVRVRFPLSAKPIGVRCWQAIERMWQRRLHGNHDSDG